MSAPSGQVCIAGRIDSPDYFSRNGRTSVTSMPAFAAASSPRSPSSNTWHRYGGTFNRRAASRKNIRRRLRRHIVIGGNKRGENISDLRRIQFHLDIAQFSPRCNGHRQYAFVPECDADHSSRGRISVKCRRKYSCLTPHISSASSAAAMWTPYSSRISLPSMPFLEKKNS